jgi:spoIIIJ-associated protein
MENFKEFIASSIEEAKEKARDYFNSNHIEFELLPPKFLTVLTGKRNVRIRARKKEITEDFLNFKDKIKDFLEKLIKLSGFDVEVKDSMKDDTIKYEILGKDTSFFLENKARLLDSFQHLVLKKATKENLEINITVDCDGFKEERENYLNKYLNRACETVRKSKKPYILKPLNPAERRFVHMMIQENQVDLKTESQGEGRYKKIKLFFKPKES